MSSVSPFSDQHTLTPQALLMLTPIICISAFENTHHKMECVRTTNLAPHECTAPRPPHRRYHAALNKPSLAAHSIIVLLIHPTIGPGDFADDGPDGVLRSRRRQPGALRPIGPQPHRPGQPCGLPSRGARNWSALSMLFDMARCYSTTRQFQFPVTHRG